MKLDDKLLKTGLKGLNKQAKIKKNKNLLQERRGFNLKNGSPEQIDKYQQYIIAFNIEKWLIPLKDVTFETTFTKFGPELAEEFIDQYEKYKKGEEVKLTPKLDELRLSLEKEMNKFGMPCFVKTSSRSAKDFADPKILKENFHNLLKHLENTENGKLIAISYASLDLLKMKSSKQVLINFSQSERIWHDMKLALAQREHWDESLVIRKWIDIEPDMEFRCFVVNGKLTCISQYRHLIHFPRLVASENVVYDAMVRFIGEQVQPRLGNKFPKDDYIIDLALELTNNCTLDNILISKSLDASDIKKLWVVEVNPFFETTDGCLFSWSLDQEIIFDNKRDKPLFKIRKKPSKGATSLIYGVWKEILNSV